MYEDAKAALLLDQSNIIRYADVAIEATTERVLLPGLIIFTLGREGIFLAKDITREDELSSKLLGVWRTTHLQSVKQSLGCFTNASL